MSSDDCEQGINFGELDEMLEQQDYPATTEELLDEYGEYEINHSSGTTTLRDILSPLEQENHTYESTEEVRQMIFNMVGTEAVTAFILSQRDIDSSLEHEMCSSSPLEPAECDRGVIVC